MRTLTWHHPLGDLFHPLLPSLPLSLSVSTTLAPLCRLQTSENQCSKCKPDRWPSSLTWARLWLQYMSLLLKPYSWLFTPAPPEVMQIIQLLCQKKRGGGVPLQRARRAAGEMKKKVVKYQWDGEKKQLSVSFVSSSLHPRHDSCFL